VPTYGTTPPTSNTRHRPSELRLRRAAFRIFSEERPVGREYFTRDQGGAVRTRKAAYRVRHPQENSSPLRVLMQKDAFNPSKETFLSQGSREEDQAFDAKPILC
jgi:hypothetical protein